jgi:tetratricopeptide (TPR) repeat protein
MTDEMNDNADPKYKAAFEMAATGRHPEARVKLLEILDAQPAHTSALVLLGKVEYYLKLFDDSRKRFETVLLYDPGNFAAFHGLEYYKERSLKSLFYKAAVAVVILFLVISGILYISLKASFTERITVLEQTAARQSQRLERLEGEIEKRTKEHPGNDKTNGEIIKRPL